MFCSGPGCSDDALPEVKRAALTESDEVDSSSTVLESASAESLPLLPLPGLDRRCELEELIASADRECLVETSVSTSLLRVGGRLFSCFIDVEGVAFLYFKIVHIPRLAFGVLSLASVAVMAEEIKAELSAMPLVMGTWSSGVWRFSDAIDVLQLCRVSMLPSSED
ncbi:hypothetical protein MRX96_058075 [Rhipicephalus microplus]